MFLKSHMSHLIMGILLNVIFHGECYPFYFWNQFPLRFIRSHITHTISGVLFNVVLLKNFLHFSEFLNFCTRICQKILLTFIFYLCILLDVFFIYISNIISFSSFLPQNPLSHSLSLCFYEGVPPLSHTLLPPHPDIPLHWCIQPS